MVYIEGMPKGWAAFIDLRSFKIRFLHLESGHIQDKTPVGFIVNDSLRSGSNRDTNEIFKEDKNTNSRLRNNSLSNSEEEQDSGESCGSLSVQHEDVNDDVQEDQDEDRNGSESGGDTMHTT